MKVVLEFDYYKKVMYIPEGYIQDLKSVQMKFFDWIYEEQECLIKDNKILCLVIMSWIF